MHLALYLTRQYLKGDKMTTAFLLHSTTGDLERNLICKWGYNPQAGYHLDSSIINYCDAALQIKEKGYEAVTGIKNAGIPCARLFEMMGYVYSEIDFSHRKREMKEPEIDEEEIQKIIGKKVILTDIDLVTGKTLQKVTEYLRSRNVDVRGAFMELEDWPGRSEDFGFYEDFWITEKDGLRRLNPEKIRKVLVPEDFQIYTSTKRGRTDEKIKRVSEYVKKSNLFPVSQ
jgi:orotate phosphoribosyltransferase-like protein